MSRYTFDCYVCDERFETSDVAALTAFMAQHADCEARP